jgi:RNA polymerase sigma-70 factor (ECF subfamily)
MVRALSRRSGCSHDEAEDIVQEVMMAAIDALRRQSYDRALGRFKAWLKGVIYHKITDARRRSDQRAPDGLPGESAGARCQAGPPLHTIPDPGPGPDERYGAEFEAAWQQAAYEDALDEVRHEVEPITFQAYDLYVRKGCPPREVARLLGISRNTVYLAKSRILARIRDKLASTTSS